MAKQLELELAECPELRAPVLLSAFAGWGDGAVAGTGALQYLVSKFGAQRVGSFDPDDLYQYTTTRPLTLLKENGEREMAWPNLELYALRLPDSPRDVLLLVGPEPDLRWKACAEAILDAATRCGAQAVVVLGSYWDRVSHLGQALLTGRAADAATREALQERHLPESRYQGPTGFTSALLDACTRRGLPAAGLSARAPHYAQGIVHPGLSAALVRMAGEVHGVRFEVGDLEAAAREQTRLLTQRIQQEPKLWRYVQDIAAEQGAAVSDLRDGPWQTLAATDADAPTTPPDLPTGSEMVDAVEAFFRGSQN
jgi:predicted ATP-grasp superfamily ATP-dependent carboligase